MKKLFCFLSAFLLITIFTFHSCKKDKEITKNNIISNSNSRSFISPDYYYPPNIDECYVGVSNSEGILTFTDQSALLNCILCLEEKTKIHISNFYNDFGSHFDTTLVIDTNYNALVDSLNFDEHGVYKEFEDHFGHNSLRSFMEEEVNSFIEGKSDTDFTDYPTTFTADDILRTLFNEDHELKINDTIFWADTPADMYIITNGSETLLDSLKNNQVDTSHSKILKVTTAGTCECYGYIATADQKKDDKILIPGTNWKVIHQMEHSKTSILSVERFFAKSTAIAVNTANPSLTGKVNAHWTHQLVGFGKEYLVRRKDCTAEQIDLNTVERFNHATKEGKVSKTFVLSVLKHTYMEEIKLVSYHTIGKLKQPKWYFECPH